MLKIELASSVEELESERNQWNRLVNGNETNEVFLTYEWFLSWERASEGKTERLIFLCVKGNEIVGIAPFEITRARKKRVGYRRLGFMGIGDYCDFIAKPKYKEEFISLLLDFIIRKVRGWDVLELSRIPEQSMSIKHVMSYFRKKKLSAGDKIEFVCPTMVIEGDVGFASSCMKKKSVTRHFNYFKKNGELKFESCEGREKIRSNLEKFFEQHIKRRADQSHKSLFLKENRKAFFRELVNVLPETWLDFTILKFNERPIAYHFGFLYNGKLTWYKPAFEIEYAKRSPGEVLLKFLIERAVEKGMRELDFTIGDEKFKRRFTNKIRHTQRFEYAKNKFLRGYWFSVSHLQKFIAFSQS